MSLVTQTPARSGFGFSPRFAVGMGVAALIIGVALSPAADPMLRLAANIRPHAPDWSLFAKLSPAIQAHLVTALAALVLGAVLMAARKGRTFHRVAGWVWVCLVAFTAGATLFITNLNHGTWSWIHLFTGWTLLVLPLAVMAAKRRQVAKHRKAMMGLFYGAFAINLVFAAMPGRTLWMMVLG